MRVGTVSDKLVAEALEFGFERFGVLDDLLLVLLEFISHCLLQCNSKCRDGVVVRTTLMAREDGEVDGSFKVVQDRFAGLRIGRAKTLAEEDHGTSGTAQGLVCCGGDNIGIFERSGDDFCGDQARDVGHVDNQVCADQVSDLAHALIVDEATVCRCTGDKTLGTVHERILFKTIIVDDACVDVDSVGEGLEVGGHCRDSGQGEPEKDRKVGCELRLLLLRSLVAMAQMASVREVKTHESVVRSHQSLIDLQIGRTAAQTLNIHSPLFWVEVEGLECSLLACELHSVDMLVASVVSCSWVAFRVFVAHGRAQGIEDGT